MEIENYEIRLKLYDKSHITINIQYYGHVFCLKDILKQTKAGRICLYAQVISAARRHFYYMKE